MIKQLFASALVACALFALGCQSNGGAPHKHHDKAGACPHCADKHAAATADKCELCDMEAKEDCGCDAEIIAAADKAKESCPMCEGKN